jgi:hypothetical protein
MLNHPGDGLRLRSVSKLSRFTTQLTAGIALLTCAVGHGQTAAPGTAQTADKTLNTAKSPSPAPAPTTGSLTAAELAGVKDGSLILLPFFVLSKNEQPVANLPADGVTIQQDGHPEAIRKISNAADLPLSLAILIDTRASDKEVLDKTRKPIQAFAEAEMVRPDDRTALIDFNDDAGLDLSLSNARDKIEKALGKLAIKP